MFAPLATVTSFIAQDVHLAGYSFAIYPIDTAFPGNEEVYGARLHSGFAGHSRRSSEIVCPGSWQVFVKQLGEGETLHHQ